MTFEQTPGTQELAGLWDEMEMYMPKIEKDFSDAKDEQGCSEPAAVLQEPFDDAGKDCHFHGRNG